jgi:GNAT superfamily N-acetyltransferase
MRAAGGYPVATEPNPWTNVEAEFREHLQAPDCLHLLAEMSHTHPTAVGWAFARTTERDPVFEPARVLHVHALYVSPAHRRQGIGRALLSEVLEWGRSTGCAEAELSVLVNNPARSLYKSLGFGTFEIEMTREL